MPASTYLILWEYALFPVRYRDMARLPDSVEFQGKRTDSTELRERLGLKKGTLVTVPRSTAAWCSHLSPSDEWTTSWVSQVGTGRASVFEASFEDGEREHRREK